MIGTFKQFGLEYRGNLDWLEAGTAYVVRAGSHAYGTSTPSSDTDIRGLAIPPPRYLLGAFNRFEQAEFRTGTTEAVIYDLRKFVALAADNNPNILEFLFADEADVLFRAELLEPLFAIRSKFLSRKAKHTFCGYAVSQLKRIKAHRRWLLDPPSAKPTRTEFGLPERTVIPADQLAAIEAAVRKQVDSWELDLSDLDDARRIHVTAQIERVLIERSAPAPEVAAECLLDIGGEVVGVLQAERRYAAALREFNQYAEWKTHRNPARAAMEARYGYDTKHAMHLVRLMRMAREVLDGRGVIVRRPDADELLAIRAGGWGYDALVDWAERQDVELDGVMRSSLLPREPDRVAIDVVLIGILSARLERGPEG